MPSPSTHLSDDVFLSPPLSKTADGRPVYLKEADMALFAQIENQGENGFKNFFKKWPKLYGVLFWLIGPSLLTGVTSERFSRRLAPSALLLHAGSGPRRLPHDSINVDILPFVNVDIVADLEHLPFRDNVFDAVTCSQVLEHVPRPFQTAAELLRVVKPGGTVHVACPFVFPWHPSPSDFTRWTREGLASLFPGCDVVESGIMAGPFSALNAFLPALLATVLSFGSRTLQSLLQYVFLVAFFPIKFLDIIFARFSNAELCAANFYVIVRKK